MEQSPITIPPDRTLPLGHPGLRAAYAKQLLNNYLKSKHNLAHHYSQDTPLPARHIARPDELEDGDRKLGGYDGRVCIVGAGVSGLYVATMLKYLGINNVDILEASDRVGGRCYTYKFADDPRCPHNYYDIGAMRIPDIAVMKSTLNLIDTLRLEKERVQYVYSLGYEPSMYWYSNDKSPNGTKFKAAIEPLAAEFEEDFEKAFEKFLEGDSDNYSTSSWLMLKGGLTYEDTEMAELFDTSTGLFDQAFTETLCDYSDFNSARSNDWYRVEGGMSVVTDKMRDNLASPNWPQPKSSSLSVTCNRPVVAMSDIGDKIEVTTTDSAGQNATKTSYDMVFSTTAMAPLQRMDISGLTLDDEILTGIRALSYDRATKVAIKFKTPWWNSFYKPRDRFGGVSSTDLPISNVVYPSWDDGPDKPAVLMVSYSWAQDATRMAAVVPDYSLVKPTIDDPVISVCLENLAKMWSKTPALGNEGKPPTIKFLRDQYLTHHAFAWSHDQYTGGAFALFGPGQFKNVYPHFQQMFCKGKFTMCGEALSAHHAWISGALDSAYAAVLRWLMSERLKQEQVELKASGFGTGENEHPAEVDETLVSWCVALSSSRYKEG